MPPPQDPNPDKAKAYFGYGNDAAQKGNNAYAADMYKEACKLAPDNLAYRQSLRGIQRRKFSNDPTKVGRMVGLTLQPLRMKIGVAKSRSKWADMLDLCEEVFASSPWDTTAAMDASEAAENLGLKKLAQYMVESVFEQGQKDVKFLRCAARIEEFADDYAKAIRCWERLKVILPNDEEARKKMNDLTARATIQKSGLAESLNKRATSGSGPEKDVPETEEEIKARMIAPEQRYLQEIEETPERIGPYLALAEIFKHSGRLDEAEKILAKGVKANPDDVYLKDAHGDVQIDRLKLAIDKFTRKVAAEPHDPEPKTKLDQLKVALYQYEIKELKRKVSNQPENLELRLNFGKKLAAGGKHDEAIAEFQQVRNNPNFKVQALLQTGLSFLANGVTKLAERSLEDALRVLDASDTATFNELHYHLGRISEDNDSKHIAEEHYNEVAANDYSYRDVAQRLRKLAEKPPEDE